MKQKNTFLPLLMFSLMLLVSAMFLYLFSLNEIKLLNKEKIALEEQLAERNNKLETKIVEVQRLMFENRIVKISEESLNLVRSTKSYETIYINSDQVRQIERIVSSKYE